MSESSGGGRELRGMGFPSFVDSQGIPVPSGGILRDSGGAGLIGFISSSLVYMLINLTLDRSVFFTATVLGDDLVGSRISQAFPLGAPLAYYAFHLVVMLGIGSLMAWAVHARARLRLWALAFVGAIPALVVSEGLLLILAHPVSSIHPWWSVVTANLVAGLAMASHLLYRLLLQDLAEFAQRMS
ncbi:MAG: hypothetical protein WEG36_10095 [Gemmatimonadota bacterium]